MTSAGGHTNRYRVYEATLTGLRTWREAVGYYGSFSEPQGARRRVHDDVAERREEAELIEELTGTSMRFVRGGLAARGRGDD